MKFEIDGGESFPECGIGGLVSESTTQIRDPLRKPCACWTVTVFGLEKARELGTKGLIVELIMGYTHDGEIVREKVEFREIEKRGRQLAHCEIARGTEDHD